VNRVARIAVFGVGALGMAIALLLSFHGLPHFGGSSHPYGDRAVRAAIDHKTSNAVTSLAFDQRGFDTIGEEFILVLAVLGGTLLLRPREDEKKIEEADTAPRNPEVSDAVRLTGYLALPITILIGLYLVAHGAVSPGGGFQGGVALATAIHLLYVAGDYDALEKIRPVSLFQATEAFGVTAYVGIGLAGLATGAAFLTNVLPLGSYQKLASAGTVPLLNAAVGVAVTSSVVILLSEFLEQALVIRPKDDA
jgi:multicomponent Na+:H+ antiporter subunit B